MLSCTVLTIVMSSVLSELSSIDLCSEDNSTEVTTYYAKNQTAQNCGCNPCIRRCCKPGFVYKKKFCYESSSEHLSVPLYTNKDEFVKKTDDTQNYTVGVPNCTLFKIKNEVEKFYIQTDSRVWVPKYRRFYNNDRYCVDEFGGFTPYLCFNEKSSKNHPNEKIEDEGHRNLLNMGMIISMPFLLVTLLVYAILPESSLHRKALMCYVGTLLLGYIFLVSIQLHQEYLHNFVCHFMGYSIIFFFMTSFFWMNVMCLDMWLAFSGLRGFNGRRHTEIKRFLAYCAYAFGVPILLVLVVFFINTFADKNSIYYPGLGAGRCFLEGFPNLFYFYLPMAIIIGINIILFILTAVRIQQVKKETSVLKHTDSQRHSYEDDKQKFNLYLKLLFAMGINWTMEFISWFVGWHFKSLPNYIWYLTDFANASYGVVIFFIFVFKRKILITLQKRYYVFIGKPQLAHALSTTRPTRTSNYSTTDTTVSTDYRLSEMRNGREEEPLRRH